MNTLTAANIFRMVDEIVAVDKALKGKSRIDPDSENTKALFADFDAKIDHLMGEMIAVPETQDRDLLIEQIGQIMNGGEDPAEIRGRLTAEEFIDSLLPEARAIAALRQLLMVHAVAFDPNYIKNFHAFSERFGGLVLEV